MQTVDGKTAGDAHVAVVVTLGDGREDLLISRDTNVERQSLTQPDWTCTTDADFSVFRRSLEGVKTQLL